MSGIYKKSSARLRPSSVQATPDRSKVSLLASEVFIRYRGKEMSLEKVLDRVQALEDEYVELLLTSKSDE